MGEGEHLQTAAGVSRRELIKKSVVAGGLVWAAPAVLAGPAAADHSCAHCEFLFGIKWERPGSCGTLPSCLPADTGGGAGNCLSGPAGGHTGFVDGCCLTTTTAVSCTVNGVTQNEPYVKLICYPSETAGCTPGPCTTTNTAVIDLAPGVLLCDALSKCGRPCVRSFTTTTVMKCGQPFTRVTMDCTGGEGGLSHIEILLCVLGTVPPCE